MDDLWSVVRSKTKTSSLTTAQSAIAQLQTNEKETALQMQNDEKENEKQRVEIPPISRTWIKP